VPARLLRADTFLREVIVAAELINRNFRIAADIWSCPGFTMLARSGLDRESPAGVSRRCEYAASGQRPHRNPIPRLIHADPSPRAFRTVEHRDLAALPVRAGTHLGPLPTPL
jgi:hypothetical protein